MPNENNGNVGMDPTLLYVNIRGLLLLSNRNKTSIICDQLRLYNGIRISLTETWLNSEINDAEVEIPDYTLGYRADRNERVRGGAACYLRNDLKCVKVCEYSNSVVEFLVVKCKTLDTLFITVYRPPDTSNSEWNEAVVKLEEVINLTKANGDYSTLMITGDFNMKNLKWNDGMISIRTEMST